MAFFKDRGSKVVGVVWLLGVLFFPLFLCLGVSIMIIDLVYGKRGV